MEKIEKINDYIELAKSEIYDVIEHEVELGDISMESAEFLHHCLET